VAWENDVPQPTSVYLYWLTEILAPVTAQYLKPVRNLYHLLIGSMGTDAVDAILHAGVDEMELLRKVGCVFHFTAQDFVPDSNTRFSDYVAHHIVPKFVLNYKRDGWTKPVLHLFVNEFGDVDLKIQFAAANEQI